MVIDLLTPPHNPITFPIMLTLYLTKKAAQDLKFDLDSKAKPTKPDPQYSWLAHMVIVNRRKYYLFINQQSLYSVFVDKKTAGNVFEAFKARVAFWLNKYYPDKAEGYLKHFDQMNVFKASDKKLLGHLNEIRRLADNWIYDAVDNKKLPFEFAIEHAEMKTNQAIYKVLDWKPCDYAFEMMIKYGC